MKTIYLDFDGTVVEHAYPEIGEANPYALEVIRKLHNKGYRIILNTRRVMFKDDSLQQALDYLNTHLHLHEIIIKHYTATKLNPRTWSEENLRYAKEVYIDDMATTIPLITTKLHGYMVDWPKVEKQLIDADILDK